MSPSERRELEVLHQRIRRLRRWVLAASVLALIGSSSAAVGIGLISREGAMRERQFCELTLGAHGDRERRLRNTREYLRTLAGMAPTALNEYIRRSSLPQLENDVKRERERLPSICVQYENK